LTSDCGMHFLFPVDCDDDYGADDEGHDDYDDYDEHGDFDHDDYDDHHDHAKHDHNGHDDDYDDHDEIMMLITQSMKNSLN